ncbi:MAG: glycosyltransferase [Pseudomonadota bacterium]
MSNTPPFTVIIPAYNEEAVIARCLNTVLEQAPHDHKMQIIVAANGCKDRTVEIARATCPEALVLDIPEGSKSKAMNKANREAEHFPRIYLDADVQCGYPALEAVVNTLKQPGVMAASPAIKMDLSQSNWFIRAYYRVWMTQPYVTRSMVGSGCFGLSEEGYKKIGDFPHVTGDDIWVYSRFTEEERRNVAANEAGDPVWFTVSPPRRALDQIRVEARRRLGNEEIRRDYPSAHYDGSNTPGDLRLALKNGASILDIVAYLAIKAAARLRARHSGRKSAAIIWERDLGAREL